MRVLIKCATPECDVPHQEDNVDACILLRNVGPSQWEAETYSGPLDIPFTYMLTIRDLDDDSGPVISLNIYPLQAAPIYREILPIIKTCIDAALHVTPRLKK